MYKLSKYIICLPLKDAAHRHLLLNSCCGAYYIVDAAVAKVIQSAQENIQIIDALDEDTLRLLQNTKCLVPMELDEDAVLSQMCERIHSDFCNRLNITLVPSYSCNFNCPYCFERDIHRQAPTWYKERMSVELVQAIFVALDQHLITGRQISSFTLFGGEPFMPQNKDIVRYILDKCTSYDVPISVVTNGYYLDEYIDLVKNYKIATLKITIDGTKDIHDQRRAPASGKSFERIIQNVRTALENNVVVSLRTNINRENFDNISALRTYYKSSGLTEFKHFSYYFKATMACFEEENKVVSDMEIIDYIGNDCCNYCFNSAYNRIYQPLKQMLQNNTSAFFKSEFCGAHSENLVFDPFGRISACWDLLTDSRNVIGQVDIKEQQFVFNQNYSIWHNRTVDKIPYCKECKYKLFCGGGCAAQGLVFNNDMNIPFCDTFIERFNQVAIETASTLLNKGLSLDNQEK